MVHESTMICFDNSEYMRNGDFAPTRLQAEQDAANLVLQCKIRSNPENGVGLISMGGKVDVLSTLTQDSSKLFTKLHQIGPKGYSIFSSAVKVAHLALKHRQHRNHKPRIVLFVGSPIESETSDEWVKMGKKLKKEKVNVDVICFGEADSENIDKMTKFVDTLNGKDGTSSHLVAVPPGTIMTDALVSSAVCRGEDGSGAPVGIGGGGGGNFDLGFDPNDDPELAMALRVSLEDQRQRQEREGREGEGGEAGSGGGQTGPPAGGNESGTGTGRAPAPQPAEMNLNAMTEEEQLDYALRMSMMMEAEGEAAAPASSTEQQQPMEVESGEKGVKEEEKDVDAALDELISDPDELRNMIEGLPGVESSDALLNQIRQGAEEERRKEEDKKKKNDTGKGK